MLIMVMSRKTLLSWKARFSSCGVRSCVWKGSCDDTKRGVEKIGVAKPSISKVGSMMQNVMRAAGGRLEVMLEV